jgi:hypothetical protein
MLPALQLRPRIRARSFVARLEQATSPNALEVWVRGIPRFERRETWGARLEWATRQQLWTEQ